MSEEHDDKRRIKQVLVNPDDILDLFANRGRDVITSVIFEDLPDDIEVLEVHYLPEFCSLGFIIRHNSFPVLQPCYQVERVGGEIKRIYDLVRTRDAG